MAVMMASPGLHGFSLMGYSARDAAGSGAVILVEIAFGGRWPGRLNGTRCGVMTPDLALFSGWVAMMLRMEPSDDVPRVVAIGRCGLRKGSGSKKEQHKKAKSKHLRLHLESTSSRSYLTSSRVLFI